MLRRLAAKLLIMALLFCPYLCRAETGECCGPDNERHAQQVPASACCERCVGSEEPQPAPAPVPRAPCPLPCLCNGAVFVSESAEVGALFVEWTSGTVPALALPAAGLIQAESFDGSDAACAGWRAVCTAHCVWLC